VQPVPGIQTIIQWSGEMLQGTTWPELIIKKDNFYALTFFLCHSVNRNLDDGDYLQGG
jgi:hypothetical protein